MAEQIRSAALLVKNAVENPATLADLKADPEKTLRRLEAETLNTLPRVLDTDPLIYRIVVSALSLTVLVVVIAVFAISMREHPAGSPVIIPDVLTALASAAIGALAGLLAPSPVKR